MAIKVNYVFLKTLQITKNLSLFACDGFAFNDNSSIKAMGNQWFVKEKNDIVIKSDQAENQKPFELPQFLDKDMFSKDAKPLYHLPAI